MAVTALSTVKLALNDWSDAITETAASTAADGVTVTMGADYKTVILAHNTHGSAAKTVTVKAGNGLGGVSDLAAESIASGATKAIVVDSSRFVNISGTNKGKLLIIPESTDVKFTVIEL
jgi:hypothetical protein